MFTTIRIANFKSLADVRFDLSPFTVFVGANGTNFEFVLKQRKHVYLDRESVRPLDGSDRFLVSSSKRRGEDRGG